MATIPAITVTARPWVDGRELDSQLALVVNPEYGAADKPGEYMLLWFPALGHPQTSEPSAVQAIMASKITGQGYAVDHPAQQIRTWLVEIADPYVPELEPLKQALGRAYQAKQA